MSKQSDYEKLKAIWYEKLEKEGFNDIESDEFTIKNPSSKLNSKYYREAEGRATAYYRLVDNFLNEYKFADRTEEIMWEYHANGMSCREITETLRKVNLIKTNRTSVWVVIKRLEQEMFNMYLTGYEEDKERLAKYAHLKTPKRKSNK